MEAAFYYCEHFNKIKEFMAELSEDNQVIMKSKELFASSELQGQLAIVKGTFTSLVAPIASLEEHLPLVESIKIVSRIKEELVLKPFASKLSNILQKNPGFQVMEQMARVLSGASQDLQGMNSNLPFSFKNALITMVDCERSFSKLKGILSDQRTNLTEEHVQDLLLIQWNKEIL